MEKLSALPKGFRGGRVSIVPNDSLMRRAAFCEWVRSKIIDADLEPLGRGEWPSESDEWAGLRSRILYFGGSDFEGAASQVVDPMISKYARLEKDDRAGAGCVIKWRDQVLEKGGASRGGDRFSVAGWPVPVLRIWELKISINVFLRWEAESIEWVEGSRPAGMVAELKPPRDVLKNWDQSFSDSAKVGGYGVDSLVTACEVLTDRVGALLEVLEERSLKEGI